MQTHISNKRRAKTRTYIQAGALIKLTGLFDYCNIREGDDLQHDIACRDNAAILVGIFLDAAHVISESSGPRMEAWRDAGIRFLKQHSAQKFYQKRREL